MKLPNGSTAQIDIAKLRDYCLNPAHPRGRHKARVFLAVLGLRAEHAEQLKRELLRAAREADAVAGRQDVYGTRYSLDFPVSISGRTAVIRSAWIVLRDGIPRLSTCYVLLE